MVVEVEGRFQISPTFSSCTTRGNKIPQVPIPRNPAGNLLSKRTQIGFHWCKDQTPRSIKTQQKLLSQLLKELILSQENQCPDGDGRSGCFRKFALGGEYGT